MGRHVNNDDLFEIENPLVDKLSPLISILCGERLLCVKSIQPNSFHCSFTWEEQNMFLLSWHLFICLNYNIWVSCWKDYILVLPLHPKFTSFVYCGQTWFKEDGAQNNFWGALTTKIFYIIYNMMNIIHSSSLNSHKVVQIEVKAPLSVNSETNFALFIFQSIPAINLTTATHQYGGLH